MASPGDDLPRKAMKAKVADTLKWNVVDKISTQALYAVTGIILARLLSPEDFGLVGAVMVFQAFASLFVDSGFSSALIQRKSPTRLDYSSVMWFNMAMAAGIYCALFICAPWIADIFKGDTRLISLSRVMFLTFIINASAIVPTNRFMKQMNVKVIAAANSAGLLAGAAVGISLAFAGFGAWAIVWQGIAVALVKSAIIWITGRWTPVLKFSWVALRSFMSVGMGVMGTSFLNTLFQNIYAFFIGNRAGLAPLGYYSQSDKWSKMGIMSLSQILTQSFLPALSEYQDDKIRFAAAVSKMNRLTSYLLFPSVCLLIVAATPIFHLLFGTKWDPSIGLFRILLLRGIFTVLAGAYNNYIVALGKSKLMVITELLRDGVAIAAIMVTLPVISLSEPDNITLGLEIFLWGQVAASAVTTAATLVLAAKASGCRAWQFVTDSAPYAAFATVAALGAWEMPELTGISSPAAVIAIQVTIGAGAYILFNKLAGSVIQKEILGYFFRK